MNKINDGGPAQQGMTLRDWFAGLSMQTIAANKPVADCPEIYARTAYMLADAMLAMRGPKIPHTPRDEPDSAPFARLPSLPPDVSDAFESFKLAIIRHKIGNWHDVERGDVLAALTSLVEFTKAGAT